MNTFYYESRKINDISIGDSLHGNNKINKCNSPQKNEDKKRATSSSDLQRIQRGDNCDNQMVGNKYRITEEKKESLPEIHTEMPYKISRENSNFEEIQKTLPDCREKYENAKMKVGDPIDNIFYTPEKNSNPEILTKKQLNKIRAEEHFNKFFYRDGSNTEKYNCINKKITNTFDQKGNKSPNEIRSQLNIEHILNKIDDLEKEKNLVNKNEVLPIKNADIQKSKYYLGSFFPKNHLQPSNQAFRNKDEKRNHKTLSFVENNKNLATRESHEIGNSLKDKELKNSLSESHLKLQKPQTPLKTNAEIKEEEKNNIIQEEKSKENLIDKNKNFILNNAKNNSKNSNGIFDEEIPIIGNEHNLNIKESNLRQNNKSDKITHSIFDSEFECQNNSTINMNNYNRNSSEAACKEEENNSQINKSFTQQDPNNMNDEGSKYSQFAQEYHNNSALNVYMFLNLISRFNLISQHLGLKISQYGDPIMNFSLSQLLNGVTNPSYSINKERKNINIENEINEISKRIIQDNNNFTEEIKMAIKQEVMEEIKAYFINLDAKNNEEIRKQIQENEDKQAKIIENSIESNGFEQMKHFTEEQKKINNKNDLNFGNLNRFNNKINTLISDNSEQHNQSIEQIKSDMKTNKIELKLINDTFNEEFKKIKEELKFFKEDSSKQKDEIMNIMENSSKLNEEIVKLMNKNINSSKQKEEILEMMNKDFLTSIAGLKSSYRTVNERLIEDKGKIDLIIKNQKEDHEKCLSKITKTESDFNCNFKLFYQQFKKIADVVGVSFENNLFMIQDIKESKMGNLSPKHSKQESLSLDPSKINQNLEMPLDSHFVNLISKIETMEELLQKNQEDQKRISKQFEILVNESKEKLRADFQNQLVNYSIKSDVELKIHNLNEMMKTFNDSIDKFTTKIANFQKNFCENCNSIIIDVEGSSCKHDDCSRMICRRCSDFCFCCRKLFCKKKESLKCSKCQRNVCPNCKKMEGSKFKIEFEKCEKCNNLFCSKCLKTNWPKLICKACFLVNLPESLEKLNKILSSEINIQEIPYWNFSLIQNMSRDDLKNVINILECSTEVLSINLSVLNPLKDINIFKDFINSILDHPSLTRFSIEYSDQISIKEILDYLNEKVSGLTFLEEFSISGKNIKDLKNLVGYNNNSPLQEYFHFHFISNPLPTSPFPFAFIRFTKRRAL